MSPIAAFILGLLIGWLVEWIIDWIYWRRRYQGYEAEAAASRERIAALEAELGSVRTGAAGRVMPVAAEPARAEPARAEDARVEPAVRATPVEAVVAPAAASLEAAAVPAETPDDLELIRGIGPVIARKLNQAGIYTFEQLAEKTPADLRAMLGDVIQRLSDEDAIIEQARQFAERKHTTGSAA